MKEVGTSDEFVILKSLEAVLPTSSDSKSKLEWSIVMKGYLPIAESLKLNVASFEPSPNLTVRLVIITFAISDS